jgi:hypothetical protein
MRGPQRVSGAALAAQPIVIAPFSSAMHFSLDAFRRGTSSRVAIGALISLESA